MNSPSSSKRTAEDDSDSDNSKKQKMELLKEEYNFSQLFNEALKIIKKTMKVSDEELRNGLTTVKKAFYFAEGNRFSDIDFSRSENLCAYFYRHCLLSAELSRSKILDAVNDCKVLQSRLKRHKINIVSVGGGSGCDVVGMLSAFCKKVNCKKLNITVVDSEKRWKSFLNIVEFLLREGDFGDASSMFKETNASISFMLKDVCKADCQKTAYSKVLKNADIILMKGLLSILPIHEKNGVAKDVGQKMKIGAVLLFIDSPNQYDFRNSGLEQIYPQNSVEKVNTDFFVQGKPIKDYGYISPKSNAQIFILKKKNDYKK